MAIWYAAEEVAREHKAGRLDYRPLPPTAKQQQRLPQPGCHLLLLALPGRMPLPLLHDTIPMTKHARKLHDRALLHSNQNLDDYPNITTSRSLFRPRRPLLESSRIIPYAYLRSNNSQMPGTTSPKAWKYAILLKMHKLKAGARKQVKKTQQTVRRTKSSPTVVVHPQVVQVPTAEPKTVHVPKSKRGSRKPKSGHVRVK